MPTWGPCPIPSGHPFWVPRTLKDPPQWLESTYPRVNGASGVIPPDLRGGVHRAWVCELGDLPTLCSDGWSQEWGQEGLAGGWDLSVYSFSPQMLGAGLHAD